MTVIRRSISFASTFPRQSCSTRRRCTQGRSAERMKYFIFCQPACDFDARVSASLRRCAGNLSNGSRYFAHPRARLDAEISHASLRRGICCTCDMSRLFSLAGRPARRQVRRYGFHDISLRFSRGGHLSRMRHHAVERFAAIFNITVLPYCQEQARRMLKASKRTTGQRFRALIRHTRQPARQATPPRREQCLSGIAFRASHDISAISVIDEPTPRLCRNALFRCADYSSRDGRAMLTMHRPAPFSAFRRRLTGIIEARDSFSCAKRQDARRAFADTITSFTCCCSRNTPDYYFRPAQEASLTGIPPRYIAFRRCYYFSPLPPPPARLSSPASEAIRRRLASSTNYFYAAPVATRRCGPHAFWHLSTGEFKYFSN